jgi:hypothetical protein
VNDATWKREIGRKNIQEKEGSHARLFSSLDGLMEHANLLDLQSRPGWRPPS